MTSNQITLDDKVLEELKAFTRLGSINKKQAGSDADVKARIAKKAGATFTQKIFETQKNCHPTTKLEFATETLRWFCSI